MEVKLNPVIFDYMLVDDVMTHVEYNPTTRQVFFKNYTDNLVFRAFGFREEVSEKDLFRFLEERCFSRERDDCKQILDSFGLSMYSPLGIVKKTHGLMMTDEFWIRFKGETIGYKELRKQWFDSIDNAKKCIE